MSEATSEIRPTQPSAGYAPKPSAASRDRDADGAVLPPRGRAGKRKQRKKKQPPPASDPEESSDDPEEKHIVDIRAASIRIEMPERNDRAEFSAPAPPNAPEACQNRREAGTQLA